MDNGKREFEELRNILRKLDRSLDEAQQKRTHGNMPATPTPTHVPSVGNPSTSRNTVIPAIPATPAGHPETNGDADEQPGRLKAKPLRRPRPENTGSSHGWVH